MNSVSTRRRVTRTPVSHLKTSPGPVDRVSLSGPGQGTLIRREDPKTPTLPPCRIFYRLYGNPRKKVTGLLIVRRRKIDTIIEVVYQRLDVRTKEVDLYEKVRNTRFHSQKVYKSKTKGKLIHKTKI